MAYNKCIMIWTIITILLFLIAIPFILLALVGGIALVVRFRGAISGLIFIAAVAIVWSLCTTPHVDPHDRCMQLAKDGGIEYAQKTHDYAGITRVTQDLEANCK